MSSSLSSKTSSDAAAADPISDIGELVGQLCAEVKKAVDLQTITPESIFKMLMSVMGLVERQKQLSGPQKKQAVIDVVNRLVDEIPAEAEEKAAIMSAIQLLLPSLIDTIVSVSLGELDINGDGRISGDELQTAGKACLKKCFPCCFPTAPPASR